MRCAEITRVLRPGGQLAVTVPAWLPERVCWSLSADYHNTPGGHVRIYTRAEMEAKLTAAGLRVGGHHHAHGLHSPYWWLKCAVGVHDDGHPLARAYHRLLVWDIMKRPAVTRLAEQAMNPLIGKSLVIYAERPAEPPAARPYRPLSGRMPPLRRSPARWVASCAASSLAPRGQPWPRAYSPSEPYPSCLASSPPRRCWPPASTSPTGRPHRARSAGRTGTPTRGITWMRDGAVRVRADRRRPAGL